MLRSGWILFFAGIVVFLTAAVVPTIAAFGVVLGESNASSIALVEPAASLASLMISSFGSALMVALGAMLLGWLPGRSIALAQSNRARLFMTSLLLVPICLPAYVVFYAWWQLWPADSALHAWVVRHDLLPLFKLATLLLGFWCWSWPIVSFCVAGAAASVPREREDLLQLDDVAWYTRFFDRLRTDGRGLALGGLIVFFAAFNNTTCFDLANIRTIGNELRAQDAMGAPARAILRMAAPTVAVSSVGVLLVFLALRRSPSSARREGRGPGPSRLRAVLVIWIASLLVPLALLFSRIVSPRAIDEFLRFYGQELGQTLGLAVLSAAASVVLCCALAWAWSDDRAAVRWTAHAQAMVWVLLAIVPATVIALALEAAYNRHVLIPVYRAPAIVNLAHLARFGVVPVLLAWWIIAREAAPLRDLRRLDFARGVGTFLGALRPRLLPGGLATFAIVLVLAAGEIVVSARVQPPSVRLLGNSLLQAIHYQRPETVVLAIVVMLLLAFIASIVVAACGYVRVGPRRSASVAALFFAVLALTGCREQGLGDRPLEVRRTFGVNGSSLGQFAYPRCIDLDATRGTIYVIDKTARIQRFNLEGEPQLQWRMPEWELGKPTGVSVGPDGLVYVADTHYHRVIAFDADGNEQLRFGEYGEGEGQFIYPTDVAFGPDETLYVAEYGGNDRVQVFSSDGAFLFQFGAFGAFDECEMCFIRPQAMVFSDDRSELFIADACNHRIVVTDPEGRFLRTFGRAGVGAGEMHYPYGIARLPDGTLLIAEFGNNRLQRFSPEGESLGLFGRRGAGEGELRYPWGVAAGEEESFVLDSGNNRVQVMPVP